MNDKTGVLIMAAGTGDRFAGRELKTFYRLLGRPLLVWSAERFGLRRDIDPITVVCAPGDEGRVGEALAAHGVARVSRIVHGGSTRQESVRRGLDALDPSVRTVLVHDAARPCVTLSLIDRTIEALKTRDAVIPVWPVVDTLVREANGRIDAVVDRAGVSGAQTPQGFRVDLLNRAHKSALEKGISSSDDGSLVLALGEPVASIVGERTNVKITFIEDAPIAEAILERQRL
jgi:2-C-methyl-D-erythritol 4-phosphate cytidylyltransferase